VRLLVPLCASIFVAFSSARGPSLTPARLPTTLLIHVVDSATNRPLPNTELTASGTRRLSDADGNARFTWPTDGTLSVRIRQLGFRYAQRTFHRSETTSAEVDTVVVALARSAFALPQVVTRARTDCPAVDDPEIAALSTSSMELLRFGAEQYNNFRLAYPFAVTLARHTTQNKNSRAPHVTRSEELTSSDSWGDVYRPANVLQRTKEGYFIPLLFVSTLADSVFWERHCFVARGVESRDGRRVIRLDFSAAQNIRDVEWEGSAWLDSAASVLTRVEFRLVNVHELGAPQQMEGYSVFSVLSPFIAVPDSTVARWWQTFRAGMFSHAEESEQSLTVRELWYRRALPPSTALSAPRT
jgi:hypothetical protein